MVFKQIARPLIVTAISFVMFFTVGELYSRLRHDKAALGGFTMRHETFHHLPPPGLREIMHSDGDFNLQFTTNNVGMRGPRPYNYEKPDGVFRIAVMGDSFTFGVGVADDEVFTRLLEKDLNLAKPSAFEVLNFGVPSYSPILEYVYLREEVMKYRPDLVVLMLDESDTYDDFHYEPHVVKDRDGDIKGCDPMKVFGRPDIWAYCVKHSRFLYLLEQKLFQSVLKMKTIGIYNYFKNKFRGKRNKAEILINKEIDNIYFDKFLMFRDGKDPAIVAKHWGRTARYIKLIKKLLDKEGVRFLLVVYPYGHQVGESQWGVGRSYWGFDQGELYDPSNGFSITEDFARSEGIDLLNLYEGLRARSNEQLYFDRDGHWTKRGHMAVTDIIINYELFQKEIE